MRSRRGTPRLSTATATAGPSVVRSHSTEPTLPDVRVGIVSWNTAELLDRCLAALPAALAGLDAEVVVVDNASSDRSAESADPDGAAHDRCEPVDWAIGAVHVIRAEALGGALPYSERWFMYAEDIELCWRIHRDGWDVRLEADIEVPHIGNAAGAQAWGWKRARRFWAASYDFDALAHSRSHARAWAAVNLAATTAHLAANRVGALAAGPTGERRRHAAGAMR